MKYVLMIPALLFMFTAHAEIYKTVDANGNVIYTDKPSDNAIPVTLPKTSAVSPTSAQSTPTNEATTTNPMINDPTKKPYTKFEISSPLNQDSIQNQPILKVKLAVDPNLQNSDVIQVYVDGGPSGNAEHQTTFNLTIPNRGTHILSATLFDKDMKLLMRSNSITIYVHQAHLGN